MKKIFLLLSMNFMLLACSHITVKTPVATVAPSELLHEGAAELAFRSEPARLQTVTDDASERPPVFDNYNEGSGLLKGDIDYGLAENLQIGLGLTSEIGITGQAAYQFLGKPWSDAEVGWSAAVHTELSFSGYSKNGDQNGEFGAGGYDWNAKVGMSSIGGGVSFGYRWNKDVMGFMGTSYNGFAAHTKIKQDPSDNGLDPGGTYEETNKGDSWATGLGVLLGSGNIRLIPTVQWVEYRIDKRREHGFWWGLSLAFGGAK